MEILILSELLNRCIDEALDFYLGFVALRVTGRVVITSSKLQVMVTWFSSMVSTVKKCRKKNC